MCQTSSLNFLYHEVIVSGYKYNKEKGFKGCLTVKAHITFNLHPVEGEMGPETPGQRVPQVPE